MSFPALTWALDFPTPTPTCKLVLLLLASRADDDDSCWPSVKKIMAESGLSERSVRSSIAKLIEAGAMSKTDRWRQNGSQTSSRYTLHRGGAPRAPGVTQSLQEVQAGGAPDAPLTSFEPLPEPSLEASLLCRTPPSKDEGLFERAWSTYPRLGRERSKAKSQILPIWMKAAKAAGGENVLLSAVERYVREDKLHLSECGPPSLQRWLTEGRWEHWLPGEPTMTRFDAEVIALRDELLGRRSAPSAKRAARDATLARAWAGADAVAVTSDGHEVFDGRSAMESLSLSLAERASPPLSAKQQARRENMARHAQGAENAQQVMDWRRSL